MTSAEVPLQLPVLGLKFDGDDRLLISFEVRRAILWDIPKGREVLNFELVDDFDAVDASGDLVGSADLQTGTVALVGPGTPAIGRTVLQRFETDGDAGIAGSERPRPTGRRGSVLALGSGGLLALGSSSGTFAVVKVGEDGPEVVVGEQLAGLGESEITAAEWLDEDTLIVGGRIGKLAIIDLEFESPRSEFATGRADVVQLKAAPPRINWLARSPSESGSASEVGIVFGTSSGVFSANVVKVCKRRGLGEMFTIVSGFFGVVGVILAIALAGGWLRPN